MTRFTPGPLRAGLSPYDDTAFSGRSDYQAFILNGIPPAASSPAPR
jgi:hypothetical protein